LFFQMKGHLMAASVTTACPRATDTTRAIGLKVGLPREPLHASRGDTLLDAGESGQRFLVSVLVTKPVPAPIQVVLNWSAQAPGKP
jgi:hypothetical protein